ncbi:MAG: hypothetical protein FWJ70_03565 [Micromonosporaceae bacterium]
MTGTPRIPPAEVRGLYGAMVTWFSRKVFGKVPDTEKLSRLDVAARLTRTA